MTALVSACSHHGGGGMLPATGSGRSVISALDQARQIDPTLCTFSSTGHFNADTLTTGATAWFNSAMTVSGNGFKTVNIYVTSSKLTYVSKDGTTTTVPIPDSTITISPIAVAGSTLYNDAISAWQETVPSGIPGYFFSNGGRYAVPTASKNVKEATWSAIISSDTDGITLTWRWGAASYSTLGTDYNGMGVKPMDDATATAYQNDDYAGTPENYKDSLLHGSGSGTQSGPDDRWTGHFTLPSTLTPCSLAATGGPTPTPAPTPPPPGSTPGPSPTPGGATPTPSPAPVVEPTHAAFIPNFNYNNVSVIDTSTHKVTGTISVGAAPYGVGMDAPLDSLYVGNQWDTSVSVINTATGQPRTTIPLNTAMGFSQVPYGIGINPSGTRAYVAANDGNAGGSIAVIDTASNTQVAQIIAPSYGPLLPFMPVVSPDGTRLYVSNLGTNSTGSAVVTVYDTGSNTYIGSATLTGGDGNGLTISPDGQTLYVCNGGGLSYVNTATLTQVAFQPFTGGCADVAANAAGTTLYVSNSGGNTVSVVNAALHTVTATVKVGVTPEGIGMTPSGTEVYVANANGNSVSVIATSSNSVTNTIAVGSGPYAFGTFLK